MNKIKLNVKTKSKTYPIIIGKNVITQISSILKSNNINFKKTLIIVDSKIPKKKLNILKKKIFAKKFIFFFNASEKNKNLKSVNKILNKLLKNNFSRNDCLISLGGGITGDISGFAASIFKRGIKFINVATTLLSMVDSSVGGKQGYNVDEGKNLIGSFYQPDCVISDITLLNSLPKREIICGYGEILKHSIIDNKKTFNYLTKNFYKIIKLKSPFIEKAILDSCKIKKKIVEKDEKEKDLRKILNLGHSFAHAYEAALSYSKKLNHGEAVILGIKSAAKFSFQNNIINRKDYKQIISHISNLNINTNLNHYFKKKDVNKLIKFMKSDKKNNSSKINLILIKGIGKILIKMKFNELIIKKFLIKELIY